MSLFKIYKKYFSSYNEEIHVLLEVYAYFKAVKVHLKPKTIDKIAEFFIILSYPFMNTPIVLSNALAILSKIIQDNHMTDRQVLDFLNNTSNCITTITESHREELSD